MIRSMTGFGRSKIRTKFGLFIAEARTVNHKFLEPTYKLPNGFNIFDDKVKELIKSKIRRGKLYLNLVHDPGEESAKLVFINEKLAHEYSDKLKRLKKKLGLEGTLKLSDVISFPGVINYSITEKDAVKMWPSLKECIEKTLDRVNKDREKEGSFLFKDLLKRIKKIKNTVSVIKRNADSNIQSYRKRLLDRIKELSGNYEIDKGRLEIEVALFAKNSDITEELTRLNNHINNFIRTIKKSGETGKKLDFIAQELHREINTVGSKSSGYNISKRVIEVKTEIEKIREQLKNIE